MPAWRKSSVWFFASPLAALLVGFGPTPARADLILMARNSAAGVGGTGSFDVVLANVGGTATFNVSAFSVELGLPGGSGISFTGATTATAAPYLFSSLQSPPLTFNTFPTGDFIASDSSATMPYYVGLRPGDLYGLEHVTYAVAPGAAAGPVAVSIVGVGTTTQVLDLVGNLVPFTATNGAIVVAASSAVPEPGSAFLTTIALTIGAALATSTRRRGATRGGGG